MSKFELSEAKKIDGVLHFMESPTKQVPVAHIKDAINAALDGLAHKLAYATRVSCGCTTCRMSVYAVENEIEMLEGVKAQILDVIADHLFT